ncbi:MAG: hypothetical protein H6677_19705 [Candidatus Obscuribacterales bacterium]|nr:hypothetical protein [Candidatus Obscuribacterales bacterium]
MMKKLSISKTVRYVAQLAVSPACFLSIASFPEILNHFTQQVSGIPNYALVPFLLPPIFVYFSFMKEAKGKRDIAIRIMLSLLLLGLILGSLAGTDVSHKSGRIEWYGVLYMASLGLLVFDSIYWIFKKFIP